MSGKSFGSWVVEIAIVLSLVAPAVGSAQSSAIEEIVVTAQKREQSLQDVPISVTAFSGDMVDDFGFEDTRDIFYQTPNVDISQYSYYGSITIRGNPTLNNSLAGEGNVSLYFDEVYRPTAFYGGNEMLDVERVEVLRGPQGTLFGRNSTSGLVHFISRKPTGELEGYANLELGSYDTRILEAAISGPLSDRVRGRLAVKYHENDGFQTNQGPAGGKLAVTDRLAARGHLEIDLSDSVNLLLSVEASDLDDIGKAFNFWGLLDPATLAQCEPERIWGGECVGGGAFFGLPSFGDPDPSVKRPYTEHDPDNGDGRYTLETLSATAKLRWQLSDSIELVSITAYDSHDRFFNTDEDGSAVGTFGGLFQYNDSYTSETDQFTQEFRLSGGNGETDWLLGLFYFYEDRGSTSHVQAFEGVISSQVPGTIVDLETKSWAVFGEFGRSLTETVRLIGGFRYTDEEKETDVLTETFPGSQELSDDNFSGKAGLEWRPRDEWLVYGTVSSSFRSGNFATDLLFGDLNQLRAVKPEEAVSFELGSKSTLLDGRMSLNATLFYQDVTDKQGLVYDSGVAAPVTLLITVGDADIYGAEFELFMAPADSLELSLGVGWLDSEVNAPPTFGFNAGFGTGANAFVGDPFFLDGSKLGSGWSLNGVVRYHISLGGGGNLTLQADYDWREENIGQNRIDYAEDRLLVNLRAFWSSPTERWEVQAYVENAFDEKYIDNLGAIVAGGDYALGNMGMPQWYGVKIGMNF
ncbi:MAG: TonB-dependent receptor [Gammaproteobacteria bacterium]|nr:TonB-dependent receptor [Gammaproteobacteria bacterium]MDE0364542.1 TonB-dependent receptor [Gammaproteobacteria bacterium]